MSNSPLKALHVYRTYFPDPPGGMQEAIRQICLTTGQFDVDSTIFSLSPTPRPRLITRPEARVARSRSWAAPASCDLGALEAFRHFARLAKEADVVHLLYPWPFADLLQGMANSRTPMVLTYVSDIVRQQHLGKLYTPLMWKTLHAARIIVANSPSYARTSPILSDDRVRHKVRVIPLGIDEASFDATEERGIFERIGLTEAEPYFLFVGVLRYYKGLHTLIKAAKQVGARIVIAGSGPEETNLRALAKELNVSNVVFAGFVSDHEKNALLRRCSGFVLPSHLRSEAYGMVLVEAAIFGRPLISCEIGTGTSFVNAHGESGLVVPPEDPVALAEALKTLLVDQQ